MKNMFESFLRQQKATFPLTEDLPVDLMIEIALVHHKGELNNVLSSCGTISELKCNGPAYILDRIFKCNCLVTFETQDGIIKTLLIDVVDDFSKITEKEEEIQSKEKSLYKLGIDRALVIVWSLEDFNIKDRQVGYEIVGKIIGQLDSNVRFLNTIII